MTPAQETIKNIINSGNKVLVAGEPSVDEATMLSMLALKNIMDTSGKKVFLTPAPSEGIKAKFGKIFSYSDARELPQKIKIKIPKNSEIEELRYEEDENFLNVLISPKNKIEPADLVIEKSPYEIDAAFCFFDGEAGWKKTATSVAKPPGEKTIYISGGERAVAGKINEIHEIINGSGPLPQNTATLLMASLICETDNFQRQNGAVFALANTFLGAGADQKTIREIMLADKKIGLAQILGRALARTTSEENLKTSWTFLTKNDFDKTGLEPSKDNVLFLLRKVRSNIVPPLSSIVCYEDSGGVRSLIYHENKNVLANMASALGGAPESSYFLASGFKNFSEAENRIRQLLKQAL